MNDYFPDRMANVCLCRKEVIRKCRSIFHYLLMFFPNAAPSIA